MLLLIAFGRCASDQFGLFHTTEASCCQTICTSPAHCPLSADQCHDHSPDDGEEHNNHDKPAPCQLCFIIDSDSVIIQDGVKLPTPPLVNIVPFDDFGDDFGRLAERISSLVAADTRLELLPDPPTELRSLHRCLVTKTTPVRGPSMA
ncbi:hypothetical protein JO972_02235 [Verrucomicrobiaceae bacterium 5K15]|nr:hypothetical protein [Oceaniferula flavus]